MIQLFLTKMKLLEFLTLFLLMSVTKFLKTLIQLSHILTTYSVTSSMVLSAPTPNELAAELKRLNANKSTSDSKIPTKFLIIVADVLSPDLAYLAEYMFTQGIFPDELKIAKVIPNLYIKPALTNQLKITDRFYYFRHFEKSLKN